ncbi:hypothetical protein EV702DRAFT_1040198 [Suillus placidus]|uniref:Uncharacterized protein n=1 Tax=Suillus placidus TaxID=48579 RepID=A0A9P7D968_9AGAM|nr:hypothetical protein EV702DRAFT_1040198 [Suillus placidus]
MRSHATLRALALSSLPVQYHTLGITLIQTCMSGGTFLSSNLLGTTFHTCYPEVYLAHTFQLLFTKYNIPHSHRKQGKHHYHFILKGNTYQMKWHQENPANEFIWYSKKGWTNSEISVEYIKDFNKHMKGKANSMHELTKFMLGAIPLMQLMYTKDLTLWHAHLGALTLDLIHMAFHKTGVWPFNPTVISEQMMAPSKETSCQGHLPIMPLSPLRAIVNFLQILANTDNMA